MIGADRIAELEAYAGSPFEIMTHEERELHRLGEIYQGWANRETWALNLWLSNEQEIYEQARVIAAIDVNDDANPLGARRADEQLQDWIEGLAEHQNDRLGRYPEPTVADMLKDVGSLWRVDWHEVGESLRAE